MNASLSVRGHDAHPILNSPVAHDDQRSGCVFMMTTAVDLRKHVESAGLVMMTSRIRHTDTRGLHQRKHVDHPAPSVPVPMMTTNPRQVTHSHNRSIR